MSVCQGEMFLCRSRYFKISRKDTEETSLWLCAVNEIRAGSDDSGKWWAVECTSGKGFGLDLDRTQGWIRRGCRTDFSKNPLRIGSLLSKVAEGFLFALSYLDCRGDLQFEGC
jgi:hypothetical protein